MSAAEVSPATGEAPFATVEARDRRATALELSGWGEPFRLLQPRNPCFWLLAVLIVWGAFQMWDQLSGIDIGTTALITAVIPLVVFGVVLGWIMLRLDPYVGQPRRLLAAAFIWGGVTAAFGLSVSGNMDLSSIYGKLFGQAFATDWALPLSAPFVEETAKAAGFLLLLGLAPRRIRSVCDALLVGAFIGLGFEILEDLIYTLNAAGTAADGGQVGAVAQAVAIRIGSGLFSHCLFTGLFATGLIYLIGTPALARNVGRGVLFIAAALLSHGVWDAADAIAAGGGAVVLIMATVVILGIGVFIYAFRQGVSQERIWLRDVLAPEVADGVLGADAAAAAAGTRRERRAYRRSGGAPGREEQRRRRSLVKAARSLARAVAGADPDALERARAETAALGTP